jgi:hypothetical protein
MRTVLLMIPLVILSVCATAAAVGCIVAEQGVRALWPFNWTMADLIAPQCPVCWPARIIIAVTVISMGLVKMC